MQEQYQIPDFSNDNFANKLSIKEERSRMREYNRIRKSCIRIIKQELNMQKARRINFERFELFKMLEVNLSTNIKSIDQQKNLHVSIGNYFSTFTTGKYRNAGSDEYLFGYLKLDSNFPRTYIQKETIKEKIEDLFLKRDLDFTEQKKFSRRFQVLTNNPLQLKSLLQGMQLDELTCFPDMELEFIDDGLFFRSSRKSISIEEAVLFCKMAKVLVKIFAN